MEDSQSISSIGVGPIVPELSKLGVFRANLGIKGRSSGGGLQIEPVAISSRPCSMVVPKDIVWVGNPEASWS